jgi:hypothetical protein
MESNNAWSDKRTFIDCLTWIINCDEKKIMIFVFEYIF